MQRFGREWLMGLFEIRSLKTKCLKLKYKLKLRNFNHPSLLQVRAVERCRHCGTLVYTHFRRIAAHEKFTETIKK